MRLLSLFSIIFLVGETYASFRDFGIPASKATVDVRVFNVANTTLKNAAHAFTFPVLPGHEDGLFPEFSFLVEHKPSQKRLMFDLGVRKDPQNLVPAWLHWLPPTSFKSSSQGHYRIASRWRDPLASIDAVIWRRVVSIGDMSKFPNSTGLIIGSETDTSTFPENPNSLLQVSDFAGHKLTEINFAVSNLTFSGLKAIDYFGDGSFYLLNTPGHIKGHISALARVTPTSFISLGGDTWHHAGEARPRAQFQKNFPCPAHLLEESKTSISTDFFWSPRSRDGAFDMLSRAQQLLAISDTVDSFYQDPVTAQVSLEKVATFDADPDIFVIVAHDISLRSSIPLFPAYLNGWKASGLKQQTVWNFIDPTNPAFVFSPM
ncbi:hypothetical protein B0H13DRAFT_1717460 [Mycena leptocephala]|nr:hypothetical protein B0H13DRAFT_1717460 [Mycena leptocephala]